MRQHKECLPVAGAQEECQTNIELAARFRPFYNRPRVNFCCDKFKWFVVPILTNLIGVVQLRYFWNGLLEHYVYTSEPDADILKPLLLWLILPILPTNSKKSLHIYQWRRTSYYLYSLDYVQTLTFINEKKLLQALIYRRYVWRNKPIQQVNMNVIEERKNFKIVILTILHNY